MTTTYPLFTAAENARSTDPATSHDAARSIAPKLGRLCRQFTDAVQSLGSATASEAAQECARRHGGLAESFRKRAHECVRAGTLEVCGERDCAVTRVRAQVYRVV